MITAAQLRTIAPLAQMAKINLYLSFIIAAMAEFKINTPLRICAFISQCLHESQSLLYMKECASGDEYDTRTDLGNTPELDGDGKKYKGRGALEVTGHNNYKECGEALGLDLLNHPELLELPANAWRASAWWWNKHGLNEIADHPESWTIFIKNKHFPQGHTFSKQEWLCYNVNGGFNGLKERQAFYAKAITVIV